ncbi:CAMK family protein kinase [Tritrichomonas foetus]|uniref:CAMK family protein kinase n=1 Tax=Tritrichomonas foetus TaxID=1144522 RepID=A0A1J4JGF5_9EUKA|nr:CAMK family protein kinase [Tritrichomonas foetus]|eukprot:OHS97745.1 CAMK family protein kinase [Tritrichomonas foetus]
MTTYEIFHEIGRGSFSTVCKCVNKDTGKECAVKIVPKKNLRNKSDLEGFQREINSLSLLQHPNIVSMTDFFSDDDNFYIITDICEGGQLFKHLKKFGKFPEELALEIFQQIVSALLYIHQAGVAHRDLKPQNILVGKFPEVKVADFGLCDYIDDRKDENLEKKNSCGSPCYCSPECLFHFSKNLQKCDIWSLGVILYTMVVGNFPWNVNNHSIMIRQIMRASYKIPNSVSEQCSDLIKKMLQIDPQKRISLEDICKHPFFTSKITEKLPDVTPFNHLESHFQKYIQKTAAQSNLSIPPIFPTRHCNITQHHSAPPFYKMSIPQLPPESDQSDGLTPKSLSLHDLAKMIESDNPKDPMGIVNPFSAPVSGVTKVKFVGNILRSNSSNKIIKNPRPRALTDAPYSEFHDYLV